MSWTAEQKEIYDGLDKIMCACGLDKSESSTAGNPTRAAYRDHCDATRALCRWFQSQDIDTSAAVGIMMHASGGIIARTGPHDLAESRLTDAIEYLTGITRLHRR